MCEIYLSILIVNYNGKSYLQNCLTSLAQQTYPPHHFEVILLDNGSSDGSIEFVVEQFPHVKVIQAQRNLGFAEGNNTASQFARGQYWILLNPDTIVDPYWLEEIARSIAEYSQALIGIKLVLLSNPRVINSCGLFLLRDGRGADRGYEKVDDGRYEKGGGVFACCAASLVVPKALVTDFLFDPNYFTYYEDLDLCWRCQRSGRSIQFTSRAMVCHAVGYTIARGEKRTGTFSVRNRALFALKLALPTVAIYSLAILIFRTFQSLFSRGGRKTLWEALAPLMSYIRLFSRFVGM